APLAHAPGDPAQRRVARAGPFPAHHPGGRGSRRARLHLGPGQAGSEPGLVSALAPARPPLRARLVRTAAARRPVAGGDRRARTHSSGSPRPPATAGEPPRHNTLTPPTLSPARPQAQAAAARPPGSTG